VYMGHEGVSISDVEITDMRDLLDSVSIKTSRYVTITLYSKPNMFQFILLNHQGFHMCK
jgi:hypothetical protein